MPNSKNIALKRLMDFVGNGLRTFSPFLRIQHPQRDEALPLTISVAVTGHLDLTESPELVQAITSTLHAIHSAATAMLPDFARVLSNRNLNAACLDLRLISSLAAGADQIVAKIALASGTYTLHAVLAFDRTTSAKDTGPAAQSFADLLAHCERVIELDGGVSSLGHYQSAAETLLANADILLVVAAKQATEVRPGGTRWIQRRAEARGIPTLVIATDHPAPPKRQQEIANILSLIVMPPPGGIQKLQDSGWFESRFSRTLDPHWNAGMWGERWTQNPATPIDPRIRQQVDDAYRTSCVWADHRASAAVAIATLAARPSAALGLVRLSDEGSLVWLVTG